MSRYRIIIISFAGILDGYFIFLYFVHRENIYSGEEREVEVAIALSGPFFFLIDLFKHFLLKL